LSDDFNLLVFVNITANGFGLGEDGDFHHPPDGGLMRNLPSRMINHQPRLICGALNRHFCQNRVSGSLLVSFVLPI
jgi:hypothetical protein